MISLVSYELRISKVGEVACKFYLPLPMYKEQIVQSMVNNLSDYIGTDRFDLYVETHADEWLFKKTYIKEE